MAVRRLANRSNTIETRSQALEELERLNHAAVEPFVEDISETALFDPDLEIRVACVDLLMKFKGENDVEERLPGLDKVVLRMMQRDRSRLVRKAASRFMKGALEARQPKVPPHCWGVRLQDLVDFHDEIFDKSAGHDLQHYCDCHKVYFKGERCIHGCFEYDCPYDDHKHEPFVPLSQVPSDATLSDMTPNMHLVVAREIKPRTKPYRCSFALMKSPEGLPITAFVTHTWNEHFSDLINTLRMALDPHDVVWLCSFAIDQNSPAILNNMLSLDDLHEGPFAKALEQAPKLVVTIDAELNVPSRSWCVYEIAKACEWGIPTFLWPTHLTNLQELNENIMSLDVRNAQATKKTDQERIHKCLNEACGFDAVNARLRTFVGDRLRFYEAAIGKHKQHLFDLNQQIADARRQSDAAKLFALESARNSQLRLLQFEAERNAFLQEKKRSSEQSEETCARGPPLEERKSRLAVLTEQRDFAIESEQRCRCELEELWKRVAKKHNDADAAEIEHRLRQELEMVRKELGAARATVASLQNARAAHVTVCHIHQQHTVLPPRHLGTVYLSPARAATGSRGALPSSQRLA